MLADIVKAVDEFINENRREKIVAPADPFAHVVKMLPGRIMHAAPATFPRSSGIGPVLAVRQTFGAAFGAGHLPDPLVLQQGEDGEQRNKEQAKQDLAPTAFARDMDHWNPSISGFTSGGNRMLSV